VQGEGEEEKGEGVRGVGLGREGGRKGGREGGRVRVESRFILDWCRERGRRKRGKAWKV